MGKKKTQVSLNGSPLQAITIGQIKDHKYGWIGTILLFALFIGIVFYLPELFQIFEKYTSAPTAPAPSGNIASNTTIRPEDEEKVLYKINETDKLVFKDIEFNEIAFSNNKVSLKAINKTASVIKLEDYELYLEVYDSSENLLNRFYLNGSVIDDNGEVFTYDIKDGASLFNITELTEDDYDYIDIAIDDNQVSKLTCTKDTEELIYTFKDEKLKQINSKLTYSKDKEDYDYVYSYNSFLVSEYVDGESITGEFTEEDNSFTFNLSIDYNKNNIDLEEIKYFVKDTSPREVNFKLELLGYSCK